MFEEAIIGHRDHYYGTHLYLIINIAFTQEAIDGIVAAVENKIILKSDVILNIDISELVVSIENDALTRDFTINTLYIPLDKLLVENPIQYILDPLKGLSHLNQRKLIAVNKDIFKELKVDKFITNFEINF